MSTVTPNRSAPRRVPAARSSGAGGGAAAARAATIDPFRILRRYMWLLAFVAMVGVGLGIVAYLGLLKLYPLYSGEVLFEVKPGVSQASDVGSSSALKDEEVYRTGKTQIVLLVSREVLENAVRTPDVQSKTEWFKQFVTTSGPDIQEAVDDLEDDLGASTIRGTQLFRTGWATKHKADVPIVLNAIARAYVTKRKNLDNQVYNQNLELFTQQLAQTNLEIKDLDQEIEGFITEANITSLDDPRYHELSIAMHNIIAQISQAQQRLSIGQSSYLQTAAKLEGRMEPSSEDVLEAEMDPTVLAHIRIVDNLKYQTDALRERFRDDHPSIQQIEANLRAAERQLKSKREEVIRRNLDARIKIFQNEINTYQRMLEELEAENEAKGQLLTELAAQQSTFDALRTEREHLELARDSDRQLIKEIRLMRLRADAERVGIAQEARTPRERSFPKPEMIVPMCMLGLVGLVTGLIFLREFTDRRVKTPSDLTSLPGGHVLGVIPDRSDDPTKCRSADLVTRRAPGSVLAESYRQLATPLGREIDHAGLETVVFVGGLPEAGTTTVASNVGACFAAAGRRVLVVDANFRRPRLGDVTGVAGDHPGLADLLGGVATLEETIVDVEDGLHIMPVGTAEQRIIERLSSPAFDQVITDLRSRYDLVLFDAPPAVVAGDALVVANKVDAAVLVVRAYQEQRGLVARLVSQLEEAHCDLLGIVLNRPRETAGGYFRKNFAMTAQYSK